LNIQKTGLTSVTRRFLHTTWIGSKIVKGFWDILEFFGYYSVAIPHDSPLRNSQSLFWSVRANDEAPPQPADSFFSLVNERKIELVAPARAAQYRSDGRVVLEDGRELSASVVILCTGYQSSWAGIFDGMYSIIKLCLISFIQYGTDAVANDIGLSRHAPSPISISEQRQWNHYKTLENPPLRLRNEDLWTSNIYRGLVPAKSINRHDFAINGAMVSILFIRMSIKPIVCIVFLQQWLYI
jgi:dimethylaniline monooxygenase (N-oxide forming)